jgi:23S rRNA (pseudouridine1915-N3)-methyltransferase
MKIILFAVGRLRSAPLRDVCADYLERLKRYGPAEVLEVKAAESGSIDQRMAQEGERLLSALQPNDQVLVLDERGKQFSSEEWSQTLKGHELRSVRRMVLILGGAYGISAEVKRKGTLVALSKMTLPHELCRAVILEQLYRARTIQRGEPYHHA